MNLGRITASTLTFMALAAPAWAAPLFSDVPNDHWASDAVRELAGRGILQGYNDGTFQGNRCLTRWEMANIVARLLARLEESQTAFATKADLDAINRLAEQLRPELNALGVRLDNLEKSVSHLDARVSELERITYYGRVSAIGVSNIVKGSIIDNGGTAIDWTTGRMLSDGDGISMLGLLGVNVALTDDFNAGAEFAAYSEIGKNSVNAYWGVDAPYSCNIWTQRGSIAPWEQSANHSPFTRMVLDNIWVNHTPSGTRFVAGSFRPRLLSDNIFNGARNPNMRGARWLPFFGFDLTGSIGGLDSGFQYELLYSENPGKSIYDSHSYGGSLRYDFADNNGRVGLHVVNHRNERISDGVLCNAGLIPLPTVPVLGGVPVVQPNTWLGTRQGTNVAVPNAAVGPQQQLSYGIDVSYTILPDYGLSIDAAYAGTSYDPDTSKLLYNETATGNMYKVGLGFAPISGLQLDLAYQSVDPTYDPFISQYACDTEIPVYLPYGSFFSGYYQMHDYINLPNNRQGFKFNGSYSFNESNTHVNASYTNLRQIKATTPEQCQKVGNIEPLFGMLYGGGEEKGYVQGYGAGIGHTFGNGLSLDANYFHYDIERSAALAENDMSLRENLYRLDLSYPITDALNLRASYVDLSYKGHAGLINTDIAQHTPGVGLDYQINSSTAVAFDYRYIDCKQKAYAGSDYTANQIMVEMKLDF
ncbi:S-layer homology domain-containing protein [bacterium]|nr:S-layer homology domain-containing protein [bacterium]